MISKSGYETKELKIKRNIGGKKPGDVIEIQVDKDGTPIERYWRDRVKDASIDGCVEFVAQKESFTKKK